MDRSRRLALTKRLTKLAELKAEIARLDAEKRAIESEVLEAMEEAGITTMEWEDDRGMHQATTVYSSTIKIDADALEEELPARTWQSITRRVLDEKVLEDKVARGIIDIEVVAAHSTEVPRKPFVKVTTKK